MVFLGVPVGLALSMAIEQIQIEAISQFQLHASRSSGKCAKRDD